MEHIAVLEGDKSRFTYSQFGTPSFCVDIYYQNKIVSFCSRFFSKINSNTKLSKITNCINLNSSANKLRYLL